MHLSSPGAAVLLTCCSGWRCAPTPAMVASQPSLPKFVDVDLGNGNLIRVREEWPVWRSSLSLARLIANVPSLVKGKRVLELGCGLGVIGLSAARAGASAVVFSDRDSAVLKCAEEAALEDGFGDISSFLELDWVAGQTLPEEWGEFDLVVTADVLFNEGRPRKLSTYLDQLITKPGAKALIADPYRQSTSAALDPTTAGSRPVHSFCMYMYLALHLVANPAIVALTLATADYRASFWAACEDMGLEYEEAPMPVGLAMQLIGVTRKAKPSNVLAA